jgi:hypothetical protein
LNKPNPNQQIKDIFAQIRLCVQFSKITDPISNSTAVWSALTNLKNTGIFHEDFRDWDKLAPATRTMDVIETAFLRANH